MKKSIKFIIITFVIMYLLMGIVDIIFNNPIEFKSNINYCIFPSLVWGIIGYSKS